MALPSPGWTPLFRYHLRLDHPGFQEDRDCFANYETKPLGGLHPLGRSQVMTPCLVPVWIVLFNPWGFTTQTLLQDACFVGAWSPELPVAGTLPRELSFLCLDHQSFGYPFYALAGSWWITLVFWTKWQFPLGLAFAVLDTPGLLPSHVRSFRPQEDMDCPRGVLPPTGLGHFRGLSPIRCTPR
jgi:hypothetical protein